MEVYPPVFNGWGHLEISLFDVVTNHSYEHSDVMSVALKIVPGIKLICMAVVNLDDEDYYSKETNFEKIITFEVF